MSYFRKLFNLELENSFVSLLPQIGDRFTLFEVKSDYISIYTKK